MLDIKVGSVRKLLNFPTRLWLLAVKLLILNMCLKRTVFDFKCIYHKDEIYFILLQDELQRNLFIIF